ncbi:desmin [Thalassophryne amazonica]|uniref:desmin n=1 Tax=Thalassophryne amazonica TaxID=390379 RepID=UPI001471F6C8|nr:desmin [Thalassophryne amazonica]
MAMLRVSSYRRQFEDNWNRSRWSSVPCAVQYRGSARGASINRCDCNILDFAAAKALNKEGLNQFVQDRKIIAGLNDRLVRLIELARCFEQENESLERQIVTLEEKLEQQQATSTVVAAVAVPACSLDAAVNRLYVERDEILHDTEKLQKELEGLKHKYEVAVQHRILFQQEREEVAEEVDAVTAECLALREQVAIYEEQLAGMEARHRTAVETLLEPAKGVTGAAAVIKLGSPAITRALDIKEYYHQLAQRLQNECGASSTPIVRSADGKRVEVGGSVGPAYKELSEVKDIDEMKLLISELHKELASLEKCDVELEDEMAMKESIYSEEVSDLECTVGEMKQQQVDLQLQMKEQCEDYKELLREKMARDIEIAAYRGLVQEEEERLCHL